MPKKAWPMNRVIVEVAEIKGKCPVYKMGDVMVIDEPKLVLNETTAVCMRAMGPLMTHLISAAGGIDPSTADGGVLHDVANPNVPAERGVHYTSCPMPGEPHTENGPVVFRIKLEGMTEK